MRDEKWRERTPTARPKPPSNFRRFVYDSLLPLLSRPVYYLQVSGNESEFGVAEVNQKLLSGEHACDLSNYDGFEFV